MKQTNISLTLPQHEKLRDLSKETGLSKSEIMRRALDRYTESESDWWDRAPQAVKDSINRAEGDIKAGRVMSNEEFWAKHGL